MGEPVSLRLGAMVGDFARGWGAAICRPAMCLAGPISAWSVLWMVNLAPDAGAEVSGHVPLSVRKATAQAIDDERKPGG